MNDSKSTVRYLGHRSLHDGGRGFEFSCAQGAAPATMVTIEASPAFFLGPDRIAIQEAAGGDCPRADGIFKTCSERFL